MNEFDKICFSFQREFLNTFNNEKNIPFLLKYYLAKEIWDTIEKYKINNDAKIQQEMAYAEAIEKQKEQQQQEESHEMSAVETED